MSDLSLGDNNTSDQATELQGVITDEGTFDRHYVLYVEAPGLAVNQPWIDAIQGRGAGTGAGLAGSGYNGIWGKSLSNDGSGVVGEGGAAGVKGQNPNAVGVFGTSDQKVGVSGYSNQDAGVQGYSRNNIGVYGTSEGEGPGAIGVGGLAKGESAIGVQGQAPLGTGVFGTSNTGIGVDGQCGGGGTGVNGGSGIGTGVNGSSEAGVGVRANSTNAQAVYATSLHNVAVLGVVGDPLRNIKGFAAGFFQGDVYVIGALRVFGSKSAVVPHPDGSRRQLYCMESPESWFEDFGEGKLINGKARVQLDPGFASLVKSDTYHVFLTPYGDSNGLYVSRRNRKGFEVREQRNGKSDLSFSYRIVAKRKDIDGERLAKVAISNALPITVKQPTPAERKGAPGRPKRRG
jgi:hypothetical protein